MSIFSKRNIFLRFKTKFFFWFHFAVLKERNRSATARTLYLVFQVALSNSPAVVLRQWKRYRTRTLKPYFTPIWTIGFSTVTYIKLWSSVKDLQINTLKFRDTFHCRHTYIRYLQIVYFFKNKNIFPVLIDNSNNFEINKLINLVENGMFDIP